MNAIQIKVIDKRFLPQSAPIGFIFIASNADELYLGNGGTIPLSKMNDVIFVANQVELQYKPKIVNTFYVIRQDEKQDNETSLYMWTGGHFIVYGSTKETVILAYLQTVLNNSDLITKAEVRALVGDLNNLTTTNKENVTEAINEVDYQSENIDGGDF